MKKLSIRQVCLFFIAFMPVTKLFSLPSLIAKNTAQDLWISSLINLLIDFITLLILAFACRRSKRTFFQLLTDNFGIVVAKIIYAFYFVYFMVKTIIPLSEQKDYVEMTLYTLRPSILYFLPFFVVAFYLCLKPLRILGRASDILWMVTLTGVITLFALSLTNADFSAMLPIGVTGIDKILSGSYKSLTWFGDSIYLLFFMGEFICSKKDVKKILFSFLTSALVILIFMAIFYSTFTYIAHRQKFALTEISKYTAVINNIGRFDYIGIFMILISNVFTLALPLFMATRILKIICNFKTKLIPALIVVSVQVFLMLFLAQSLHLTEKIITNYLGIFYLIFGNVIPIFTIFLTKRRVKNENQTVKD